MKLRLGVAAGAVAFVILATANSGGYRYGISDQAFYIPAISLAADHTLFPRDAALLAPQMRVWAGDELAASALRVLPISLPALFAVMYVAGLILLFTGGVFVARGFGASWLAVAAAAALLTLRHRIAKTGANSLEGYMHPRMIAFALGLIAFGFLLRRRWAGAVAFVVVAGVVHPTTALWFGAAIVLGWCVVNARRQVNPRGLNLLWMVPLAIVYFMFVSLLNNYTMDPVWSSILAEKDYLFPNEWPAYAWALNLLYPVVIAVIYRRRKTLGRTAAGEWLLVTGLLGLVAGFLISVPLAAMHNVTIVQLQVNRVFWLLDAIALIYVAWWLVDDLASRRRAATVVVLGVCVALASARGIYILHDTGRAFARLDLPADDWTDAMRWIRSQPPDQLVLADPGHAWKYGTSVRVAALHDTVLEQSKDSAMAMYDRTIGYRISDRAIALSGFETFTEETFITLARRYGAHLLVLERQRDLKLPRLYQNARFAIYDLR